MIYFPHGVVFWFSLFMSVAILGHPDKAVFQNYLQDYVNELCNFDTQRIWTPGPFSMGGPYSMAHI